MQECFAKLRQKISGRLQLFGDRRGSELAATGKLVVYRTPRRSSLSKSISIRLYSATHLDPVTGFGKLSGEASLRSWKKTKHGANDTTTFEVVMYLEEGFGTPGAMAVKHSGRHQEFFLQSLTLDLPHNRSVRFECNSWVFPMSKTNADRLFFSNTSYLPSQTPAALQSLREEELRNLRGNGRGQREKWERIYDYDQYNDLGERPILGGSNSYPYPRRCRTGRPLNQDRMSESRSKIINLDFYVPPDDRFSPAKLSEFISNSIRAVVHFVVPEVKSLFEGAIKNFESFEQMSEDLYSGHRKPAAAKSMVTGRLKALVPEELHDEIDRVMKENPFKFPIPQVVAADEHAWRSDEEFAREMLAGLNPAVIRCLETFPIEGRGGRSSITAAQVEKNLEGLSITEATTTGRMFMVDHHEYLMPYLRRINEQGVCAYASRTLLFLRHDQTLKPVAIELSLPGGGEEEINRVFLPAREGTEAALWQLAKTHVAVNDSGHHQLISHWLHTHAAVEPFIIAARRQLSVMHPIYKLLDPHFKDTMHINSLARSILLNAGGILERTMFLGKYAMELSSAVYKSWRFRDQALPADLLKRNMAVEDDGAQSGVRLRFDDYPYAADGLDVWAAIETWVTDYCAYFYRSDAAVVSDVELQACWREVREVGHGDKRDDAECWFPLDSVANLARAITTLIWIASALHAAVNFGQFGYAGYPPNRPTRCYKFIPEEGTPEFAEFLRDPDRYFLQMIPDRFTTTLGIALMEVLSGHTADEVYLGQRMEGWTEDGEVLRMFERFGERLREVEKTIEERNGQRRLKNRFGPARVPYTLLFPDTSNLGAEKGITGRGIPNSVSI
ncbi:putative linoleate 9S-lipoxygenase 5 [Curcuma longa]|uniref:putative linoleate 9S-lipoxygenase 5 n=1 Tax=Curcuma longa TaxID=136217 RepID=UPI003D9F76D2